MMSDSWLVVNQVNKNYQAKGKNIQAYVGQVKELMNLFKVVKIKLIPREHN